MKDLSMHVLDIASNSVRASATHIDITIEENLLANWWIFTIEDNGCGMSETMVASLKNPFTTSRKMRKVGLGIPLLSDNCNLTEGSLDISSKEGQGTSLVAKMRYNHIDRPPMGDMASTICNLITSNEDINIHYTHKVDDQEFEISTRELQDTLDGVPLTEIEVMQWLRNFLEENIEELHTVK